MENKIEYAWVIQRDDGMYLSSFYDYDYTDKKYNVPYLIKFDNLVNAYLFENNKEALGTVSGINLFDCKVVRIKMEICEE